MIGIDIAWFIAVVLLVMGLHRLSSPVKASRGLLHIGAGMAIALVATVVHMPPQYNVWLLVLAVGIGGGGAVYAARRGTKAPVPQTIALFNGLGAMAATSIAMLWLLQADEYAALVRVLAVVGTLFGGVAMAGSLAAWFRLRGQLKRRTAFASWQVAYIAVFTLLLLLGLILAASQTAHPIMLIMFVLLALGAGTTMVLPIGLSDLPVVISLFNALTGLAVALDGFLLEHPVMIVAGALVFAAGGLLTRLMARAVNRRLSEIMYSGLGIPLDDSVDPDSSKRLHVIAIHEAATRLAFAGRVVIVPGYGMAVAHAQHKLRELTQLLEARGVHYEFGIHPVAGRMPGHMDVLLSEAGVPHQRMHDLESINPQFEDVDVVLVVGANDIVNPAASNDPDSPLYGMPRLIVEQARRVIILDRGTGTGYSGIENALPYHGASRIVLGDARVTLQEIIDDIRLLA